MSMLGRQSRDWKQLKEMSRCLQEGDKNMIVLAETWANQLGRRQLMQYAGRQGGTLLVKAARLYIHMQMTPREEHFIFRDCLGKQLW